MNKISLFVMTEKGFAVVKRIVVIGSELVSMVVIGRDSNVENDYSEEIAKFCKDNRINYFFRGEEPKVDENNYIFAISWRWMISHPQNKLVVFHDSLLPKYRGFAPLVNMLINGEDVIGVSALFGASEYDRGEIIGQKSSNISYPIKISKAIEMNNQNFLELAENIFLKILDSNRLSSTPQIEREASYSIWRDFDDYFVDWSEDAHRIKRLIDAVGYPYLGARSRTSKGDVVVIEDSEIVDDVKCELRHFGKVIFVDNGLPIVICGVGLLKITKAFLISDDERKEFLPMKGFRVRLV